jgi:ERO1-like protein alpha
MSVAVFARHVSKIRGPPRRCASSRAAAALFACAAAAAACAFAAPLPVLSGAIAGCAAGCPAETAEAANAAHLLPTLRALSRRRYFRYFKTDLWRRCPFWPEDGTCSLRDCAVCECDPDEVPVCWRQTDAAASAAAGAAAATAAAAPQDGLARVEFEGAAAAAAGSGAGWQLGEPAATRASPAPAPGAGGVGVWADEQPASADLAYVNLLKNPEGYTGYEGAAAQAIWRAIYEENCFGAGDGAAAPCEEDRVFYRLVSGLQSSINTHIAMTFNEGRGALDAGDIYVDGGDGGAGLGGGGGGAPAPAAASLAALVLEPGLVPSLALYRERLGAHPDRLQNLYFCFLFVTRALARARPLLEALDFDTGDAAEDTATRALVAALYAPAGGGGGGGGGGGAAAPVAALLHAFDEESLFGGGGEAAAANAGAGAAATAGAASQLAAESRALARELADFDAAPAAPPAPAPALAPAARRAALRASWRGKYVNISRILDCVGCEKCRLWGQLQFLGLGTAMKIVLAADGAELAATRLSRNEVVALVNTLHRLSMSVAALAVLRDVEAAAAAKAAPAAAAAAAAAATAAPAAAVAAAAADSEVAARGTSSFFGDAAAIFAAVIGAVWHATRGRFR